jgi:hypothetical protein
MKKKKDEAQRPPKRNEMKKFQTGGQTKEEDRNEQ